MAKSKWNLMIKKLSKYKVGDSVTKFSICKLLKINPQHRDLMGTYLSHLNQMGYLEKSGEENPDYNKFFYTICEQIPNSLYLKEVNEWIHRKNNPPTKEPMKALFHNLQIMEDLQKIKTRSLIL